MNKKVLKTFKKGKHIYKLLTKNFVFVNSHQNSFTLQNADVRIRPIHRKYSRISRIIGSIYDPI